MYDWNQRLIVTCHVYRCLYSYICYIISTHTHPNVIVSSSLATVAELKGTLEITSPILSSFTLWIRKLKPREEVWLCISIHSPPIRREGSLASFSSAGFPPGQVLSKFTKAGGMALTLHLYQAFPYSLRKGLVSAAFFEPQFLHL